MTDYEKLKGIIQEAENLIGRHILSSDNAFQKWLNKTRAFLRLKYGEKSFYVCEFEKISYWTLDYAAFNGLGQSIDQYEECKEGLIKAKGQLENILDAMEEEKPAPQKNDNKKVFIVHGHDGELKVSVARLVERQGIEAIILSSKANQGKTIIEKIEKYSDVGGAICLFTADDLGKEEKEAEFKKRARQNVVFETGYFMGKLGRAHLAIIAENGMEMPSDLSGVVYTNKSNWELDLLRELKAMGYSIDYNKLD